MKTTKALLLIVVAGGLGFAGAVLWMNHPPANPPVTGVQTTDAPAETASGQAVPKNAVVRQPAAPMEVFAPPANRRSPEEILNELAGIHITPGLNQGRLQYRIMSLFEQLTQCGQPALPVLRAFLASGRDVAYELNRTNSAANPGGGGGPRNRNSPSLLPPSLRFGLFDVVREIGGAGAEEIFAESLNTTARGAEFIYLVQNLEALYPGKYREQAIAAAKSLLAGGKITDPNDRNNVYDVLRQFNDTSYAATAQAQWLQPDGKVDRSALRYLQQTLGEKSLALAAQALQSGRVTDPDSKEALGRVGLNYVGAANDPANDQAVQLFHTAINDPSISPEQRRNLIEDLNEAGLSNPRHPTPEDLKMIAKRNTLIRVYQQQPYVQNDPVANNAFQEAGKDTTEALQNAGINPPAP